MKVPWPAVSPSASGLPLRARRIGLDTGDPPIIITHRNSPVCRSEGFSGHARVRIQSGSKRIIATLYQVDSDWLGTGEAALSESAWRLLDLDEGDTVQLAHPQPLGSLSRLRGRLHGRTLSREDFGDILADIAAGRYSDIHVAMFLTAMAMGRVADDELIDLTAAMVAAGQRLQWPREIIADKHCVGGLPGNRTTPLVVAVVAACGLWMPKTSSRAITSPAGTADTMETLAPVNLDLRAMRRVVEKEGGCVVWGGAVGLSPVDDLLIRVARVMDLDGKAQLIASVLSKKIAAGSTHLVLDLPIGATAKIRSAQAGRALGDALARVAGAFGITSRIHFSRGDQPVGRGIGPALEARDVLAVLANRPDAPGDLRERALALAADLLELADAAEPGAGLDLATRTLESGAAEAKFDAICEAQGGRREPPIAPRGFVVRSSKSGRVICFDNRRLSQVAKLAGAPGAPAAGLELHVRLGDRVEADQALFTLHAETTGELDYARDFVRSNGDIVAVAAEAEA
ncbi:MAG: thymidine phosphorylase family protein [Wenzhouxiangella sp.]|nr:thymidine phosphorylase family protein [Wenzhouxiangella sp.]